MRTQETIMRESGYVTAADAARAIGADNVGTLHRMVRTKRLKGCRAGNYWYVSVASLLLMHEGVEPLMERIRALGVPANPEHTQETPPQPKKSRRKSDGRKARKG